MKLKNNLKKAKKRLIVFSFIGLLGISGCEFGTNGQDRNSFGGIEGKVFYDPSGNENYVGVEGAIVTKKIQGSEEHTGVTTRTKQGGNYGFGDVQEGGYSLIGYYAIPGRSYAGVKNVSVKKNEISKADIYLR